MGYSVLYVAFGVVALWLLGEVLLQYKARLRWRVLAFTGFVAVVGGVAMREVAVILLGAVAFGTGQTFVTLSYKRGFSTGWALGGRPGSSRRRKGSSARAAGPVLEVTPVEPEYAPGTPAGRDVLGMEGMAGADGGDDGDDVFTPRHEPVYQPVPMHDDSGEYPAFDTPPSSYTPDPYTSGGYEGYGAQGYTDWGAEPQPAAAAASYEGAYDGGYQNGGYDQGGWGGHEQGQGYEQGQSQGHEHGYGQAPGYPEQQPAAAGYDTYGYQNPGGSAGDSPYGSDSPYGGHSGYDGYAPQSDAAPGQWTPEPPAAPPYGAQQPASDPYAGYGYDPQTQAYIPQQQHQSSYEQQQPQQQQQSQAEERQQQPEPQGQQQYADPYDPYRY